ncbi:regulatory protein, gntR family [Micromonospora haikouensis]|uniref:Regulatory protein, gntR family n=1 Tax=Micromonospora haikouensis TaxID=686309 RepID=A0A1C4WUA3_9ACTN|nr:GntR family transcriptional regulator [Micromonospora haikouensis]SCE99723.1 regulatory protein, gntR family [Micromonospora haikouensis]
MVPYVPLWRRIRQDILDRINAGILKPGDKLPTTKELADQYDTSGVTVRKAIDILIESGVLEGRQGIGVFVADDSGQQS